VILVNMRDAGEIEQSVATFARSPNGGLIPIPSAAAVRHRDLILTTASRYKLPAVYGERLFVAAGGLISYGPDLVDQFRQATNYVDRILKGDKPADLPVQTPTKYETVLNLKTSARHRRASRRLRAGMGSPRAAGLSLSVARSDPQVLWAI